MKIQLELKKLLMVCAAVLLALSAVILLFTEMSISSFRAAVDENQLTHNLNTLVQKAKFHTVQIQQFMTDASLTGETDSIKEAKENLDELIQTLEFMKKLKPELISSLNLISESAKTLFNVGNEMTEAYWKTGKQSGDAIMKRPKTGLDAASVEISQQLESLAKSTTDSMEAATQGLQVPIMVLRKKMYFTLAVLALSILVVFGFINHYLTPLLLVTNRLQANAKQLETVSGTLKENSQSLAAANNQQASVAQETAASVAEIQTVVDSTFEEIKNLNKFAQETAVSASDGKGTIFKLTGLVDSAQTAAMKLCEDVKSGNKELDQVIGIIGEIASKTQFINDVVFQTKLLSFNASVEAARAGEAGKGFAVVAEEIGNLAVLSGKSSQEINELLATGTQKAKDIISKIESQTEISIQKTQTGLSQAAEASTRCEESFDQVSNRINSISKISENLYSAINEQKTGIVEINRAIESLELVSQNTVKSASTVESSSDEVKLAVNEIGSSVNVIDKIVLGQMTS